MFLFRCCIEQLHFEDAFKQHSGIQQGFWTGCLTCAFYLGNVIVSPCSSNLWVDLSVVSRLIDPTTSIQLLYPYQYTYVDMDFFKFIYFKLFFNIHMTNDILSIYVINLLYLDLNIISLLTFRIHHKRTPWQPSLREVFWPCSVPRDSRAYLVPLEVEVGCQPLRPQKWR